MTELIEAVARNLHGELSRIDVMRYLEMPDDTAGRLTTAALTAITDAGYRIVKDEVVAWMYTSHAAPIFRLRDHRWLMTPSGWTETPLYAAPGDEK